MSPVPPAEALAVALDDAQARAATAGRAITDAAADLDSVARRLAGGGTASGRGPGVGVDRDGDRGAGGWSGLAGQRARSHVADAAAEARVLAGNCLHLADVLRVEAARLVRAVINRADDDESDPGSGDATAVENADHALTLRLREAADCLAGLTDAATRPCIDLSGSTDDDPRGVARLWHSLGPADRERLARDHPELGSVAGLSSATRDALNRTRLRRMLEPSGLGSGGDAGRAGARAGLEALASHLAEVPDRYLLSLHADGRAVVASGDPDGADRVVTLIPGTGSSLESIARTGERAEAVCKAVDAATETCVAVSWQGYAAPADVASAGFSAAPARGHAADLRDHAAGLDAVEVMDGHDAPHAAVGYSYGSAVLGAAAADPEGVAADRMIHVGSPGATVDSLAEQHVDAGGIPRPAGRDEVVGVVSRWDPVPWWSVTGVLGERPGTQDFGGLAVDVTEPGSGAGSAGSAHSAYFDPGTVSLEEIGRLVAETE